MLTAILWGAGTALGEVPPYLISYSAAVAGKKAEALEEIEQVGWGAAGGCVCKRAVCERTSMLCALASALVCVCT